MKRLNYLIGAIVATLGLGSPAFGAGDPPQRRYQTDEQLRFFCTPLAQGEADAKVARALCQSYVIGVVDGHEAATGINKGALRVFCLPEGTFNAQLTDAVISWLKAHPPADQSAAFTVFSSLHGQFPCVDPHSRTEK